MPDLARAGAMSLDEFLAWEEAQPERYERLDGVVRMMTGGTLDHKAIADNIAVALRSRLRDSGCRAFSGDIKVVAPTADIMYPDVLIVCGRLDGKATRVENPVVVFEVLSDSTEARDQKSKRWAYQSISSLQHYVLVDQNRPMVEVASRADGDTWRSVVLRSIDGELRLDALNIALPLREVFEDIAFPEHVVAVVERGV